MDLLSQFNHMSPAIVPIYSTPEINQDIKLYSGLLKISHEGETAIGEGSISFVWFPRRGLKFQFEFTSGQKDLYRFNLHNFVNKAKLCVPNSERLFNICIEKIDESNAFVIGWLNESISIGSGENLNFVLCHIANLYQCFGDEHALFTRDTSRNSVNRHILEANGWKLTIDDTETLQKQEKHLDSQGGFSITHVARLEKSDAQQFSGTDASNFLEICSDFLSFARGFRIPIFLLVGYDQNEQEIWKYWNSNACKSWQGICSWLPIRKRNSLSTAFPGFVKLHSAWGKSFKILINEYLESNMNGRFNENSIVLTQIALELISWEILVQEKGILTEPGFKKLPASDRIRVLLSQYDIPLKIPPDSVDCSHSNSPRDPNSLVPELQAFDWNLNPSWKDGPHALTDIRNNIVHPKKSSKLSNANLDVLFQARFLGIWYLEMSLLARMSYTGCYSNRLIIGRHTGTYDMVPWAKPIP